MVDFCSKVRFQPGHLFCYGCLAHVPSAQIMTSLNIPCFCAMFESPVKDDTSNSVKRRAALEVVPTCPGRLSSQLLATTSHSFLGLVCRDQRWTCSFLTGPGLKCTA